MIVRRTKHRGLTLLEVMVVVAILAVVVGMGLISVRGFQRRNAFEAAVGSRGFLQMIRSRAMERSSYYTVIHTGDGLRAWGEVDGDTLTYVWSRHVRSTCGVSPPAGFVLFHGGDTLRVTMVGTFHRNVFITLCDGRDTWGVAVGKSGALQNYRRVGSGWKLLKEARGSTS